MGSGAGRRYEFKMSSPVAVTLRVCEGAGDAGDEGAGVALADRLLDDLLL